MKVFVLDKLLIHEGPGSPALVGKHAAVGVSDRHFVGTHLSRVEPSRAEGRQDPSPELLLTLSCLLCL